MKKYKINTRHQLGYNIRMVLQDIIQDMALFKEPLKEPENAIHQSRKSIKRIRAILKMVQDEAGYSFYHRENLFFRDLSRRMSPARDLSVLLQTLDLLEKKYRKDFNGTDLQFLREHLSSHKENHFEPLTGPQGELKAIAGELDKAVLRIHNTLNLRDNFNSIGKGIKRTYQRSRRYLKEMQRGMAPSEETFHEYRKHCRYLQYQVELIQPLFTELLKSYVSILDDYTKQLGKIRDFQRFELYLQEEVSDVIGDSSRENIRRAVNQLRSKTMEGVFRNGGLIFAEKPVRFIERIHRYWDLSYSNN